MKSGKFIVFEGPDGSGKSTQAQMLSDYLTMKKVKNIPVREPGTTEIGEDIRKILSNPARSSMLPVTEMLLYVASRAQLIGEVIEPALQSGITVVSDRFLLSTVVYQGIAGGLGSDLVEEVARLVLGEIYPDITFVIDIPVSETYRRLGMKDSRQLWLAQANAPQREELKPQEFHNAVREAYRSIAASNEKIVLLDGKELRETLHTKIVKELNQLIE